MHSWACAVGLSGRFAAFAPHSQKRGFSNSAEQKKEAHSSKLQALLSQDAKIVIKNILIYA